jgi:multidrug efflux pump subunit AcrB
MSRTQALVPLIVLALAAGVLSLALAVGVILVRVRGRAIAEELPALTVEAEFPGATAAVVEQELAAPLEEQIEGVQHLRRLRSRSGRDGSYRLEVSFARGTDDDLFLKLVQNRAGVAMPALPAKILGLGLTVRKPSPGLLMLICVYSRDALVAASDLNAFAEVYLRHRLARVAGVSRVVNLGVENFGLRIRLDLDKLAARKLTIGDVTRAIASEDLVAKDGASAVPGGTSQVQPNAQNIPGPADQLESIVIKSGSDGGVFRLRDVTSRPVNYGSPLPAYASLEGKPVAVLAVYPFGPSQPREISARVRATLDELREECFPPDLNASTDFDFSQPETAETPGFLLIDVNTAAGATTESIAGLLNRSGQSLKSLPRVQNVLALDVQPFDRDRSQPCLVARLGTAKGVAVDREQLVGEIRERFVRDVRAYIRIRDVSGSYGSLQSGYPIHFAIVGPDRARAQTLAGQFVARLSQDGRLTDLWSSPRTVPITTVDIDQAKATAMGVSPAEISASTQPVLGPAWVRSLTRFGRTSPIWVEVDSGGGSEIDTFKRLEVRDDKGKMVAIHSMATLRRDHAPDQLERIDLFAAVSITANLAGGLSLAEARFVCEGLAEEVLPTGRPPDYRLTWLREMPAARAPAKP